ncbi:helix-turn-helix domain-containing protein [Streptomyces sp. NPDC054838]
MIGAARPTGRATPRGGAADGFRRHAYETPRPRAAPAHRQLPRLPYGIQRAPAQAGPAHRLRRARLHLRRGPVDLPCHRRAGRGRTATGVPRPDQRASHGPGGRRARGCGARPGGEHEPARRRDPDGALPGHPGGPRRGARPRRTPPGRTAPVAGHVGRALRSAGRRLHRPAARAGPGRRAQGAGGAGPALAGRRFAVRATAECGWSARTLRARFREQVGLSPKAVARLFRLQHALRRLAAGTAPARVAAACGYHGQAHLRT